MAEKSPPLEDSQVTVLLASPAVPAEDQDPLATSPARATDQGTVPIYHPRNRPKPYYRHRLT